MYDEIRDAERPTLRIEQPPDWWIEQRRREEEEERDENPKSSVLIIDMGTGEEKPDKDESGVVIINL